MSRPSSTMEPDVGESMPPSMLRSVVLPAPEGPTMTTSSPRSMAKSMPSTAATCTSPIWYTFRTSQNSTKATIHPLPGKK